MDENTRSKIKEICSKGHF